MITALAILGWVCTLGFLWECAGFHEFNIGLWIGSAAIGIIWLLHEHPISITIG